MCNNKRPASVPNQIAKGVRTLPNTLIASCEEPVVRECAPGRWNHSGIPRQWVAQRQPSPPVPLNSGDVIRHVSVRGFATRTRSRAPLVLVHRAQIRVAIVEGNQVQCKASAAQPHRNSIAFVSVGGCEPKLRPSAERRGGDHPLADRALRRRPRVSVRIVGIGPNSVGKCRTNFRSTFFSTKQRWSPGIGLPLYVDHRLHDG